MNELSGTEKEILNLYRQIAELREENEKKDKELKDLNRTNEYAWEVYNKCQNLQTEWLESAEKRFENTFNEILPYQHKILYECFDTQYNFLIEKFKIARQGLLLINWLFRDDYNGIIKFPTLEDIQKSVAEYLTKLDEKEWK